MEAQGGAGSPDDNKKGQKLLKPSTSGELSKEHSQHSRGEEDRVIPGHTPSLLHVTDRRQPLSSVSSLEVHFDLLDLTELTDMSDQELAEVFVDSDEENPESPAGDQDGVSEIVTNAKTKTMDTSRLVPVTFYTTESETETTSINFFSNLSNSSSSVGSDHTGRPSLPTCISCHHHPGRGSYLRSPSWTRCTKPEQSHDRKHHSDSDSTESYHKLERPKKP
ncbi:hypothetical protein QTP70_031196 [Hemibagrus guttatus]|uniref:Dysbindin domain-containing protein 1 n=1 Tax=Hemibagrus guttatus TaxID=175788 RepID=A0AAE0VCC8_9TELE|nr:hypothetical protein QTP70_031196 [Hemibagrus guttatus]